MSYELTLANIKGIYKLIKVWNTETDKIVCQACGHIIKNIYVIQNVETKENINVGSECVKNLLGDKEADRVLKGIKTIQSQVKTEYENPIKNVQLKKFIEENQEIIKDMEENPKYKGDFYKKCLWRVNNNTNADQTKRDIKYYTDLDCKFKFTKEQKQELKTLQQKSINEFLNKKGNK